MPTANDAADLYEYLSDPAVYTYEPSEPISPERSVDLAQKRAAAADFWAIELKDSRKMIGHLYFTQIEPAKFRTWELGYIVNPAYQGKGYATEAATALLRWAFKDKGVHRVIANCNPDNLTSWKVLEKVGLRREGLLRNNIFFRRGAHGEELWTDTYEYALLEEEAMTG